MAEKFRVHSLSAPVCRWGPSFGETGCVSLAVNHPGAPTEPETGVKKKNFLINWLTAVRMHPIVLCQSNPPRSSFNFKLVAASSSSDGVHERRTNSVLYFPSLKAG